MLQRLRVVWLPRLLFVLTTAAGLGLLLAVALAPWALGGTPDRPAVLRLFAQDTVVRKTAVVSGLGLLVTAFVFFRPAPGPATSNRRRPPTNPVGA